MQLITSYTTNQCFAAQLRLVTNVVSDRGEMNLHLYLFCFFILVSLAGIQPSSAHPASNARPLKREKRIRGCSEISLSGESVREWKHAPKSLELAVEAGAMEFPVHRKWSHFVQVFVGEGSWEREKGVGGRAEVCGGWVEGDQRSDVVLVKKTAAGSTTPQVCTCTSV